MSRAFAKWFYNSKEWLKVRAGYIESVNGLCERCLKKSRYVPGYIVHHKEYVKPENINDPNITLNWDNLEYLCTTCHQYEHFGKHIIREDVVFDDDGNLIER